MIPKPLRRAALRAVEGLPTPPRELALALATRAGHGPTLLPGPPPGPVLVVAPHPDDEAIGPGATIARHVDAGDEVRLLVITSGGATAGGSGDVTALREEETRRAMAHVGLTEPITFGRLPDGDLPARTEEVAALISRHADGIRTLYVPSLLDPHPDHHAVAVAAGRAVLPPDVTVLGYEVWAAGPVDVLLDVTDVFARKQAALAEYVIALEAVDYVRSASGLAAYRSAAGMLGGRGFAEGFTRFSGAEYAALVARLADPEA